MSKNPTIYIGHILDEIEFIKENLESVSAAQFQNDETLKRAVVRSLEIIGEATKKLPDEFRQDHDQIPWRQMAGMRDVLIHDYFGVDYDIVWDVVTDQIPELKRQLSGPDMP